AGFASVALNAGDNSLTVYPNGKVPALDAAGDPRFVGGSVDMGAYESPLGPTEIPSLIVTTAEDVVDPYDGDISLREAVAYANNFGLANTITFAASINGSTFYLNSELKIGSDLTIDGLANGAVGIVLTTSNDVADQRIINVDAGNVVINGVTITNRRSERLQAGLDDLAIEEGGAIYVRTGSVSIYNSLITDNAAEKGSAVYVNEENSTAYAKLVNCTVVANAANGATDGAALYAELGSLQLYNTIVALNEATSTNVAQDVYQGAAASNVKVYNTFVSRSETLAGMVSGNGAFIGSTKLDLTSETNALFVDADNQNYRLNDDALATNAGNNSYFNGGSFNGTFDSFDLDGNRRVYYSTTDMGAFENQRAKDAPFGNVDGSAVTLNVTTGSDVVDSTDGKTSLREALALSDRVQALGYDSVTIRFRDDYTVKVGETAFQVNSPVTILGSNATIDCDNANSAFLIDADGKVVIENFEIKNGSALDGGAIKLSGGDLTLVNVLMNNCEATVYGGALYVAEGAKATLYNVTAAKNVAIDGAGVYGAAGSTVAIYNSVIAANRSATSGVSPTDVYFAGNDFELAYSLVGNAGTAANASKLRGKSTNSQIGYGVDAEIDPVFIAANDGNFRLSLAGSPAVAAGSSDYVYGWRSNDLNGQEYGGMSWVEGEEYDEDGDGVMDGRYPGHWVENPVSMGAYQVSQEARSTVVTTLEDVVNPFDGVISLREALNYAEDAVSASGAGSLDGSAYAATNAMNTVYSPTFYSAVTFDPSLAGGTIVLSPELGTITMDRRAGTGSVYDYVIDASSIAGLGGITIDGSRLGHFDDGEGGMGGWFGGATMFQLQGHADTTNGLYWPVHLDLRNVHLVGSGEGTAIDANRFAMVSMRSSLIEGYRTAVSVQDDDSADGGIAHIYSSTLIGDVQVGGKAYVYNSIITGTLHVHDKTNDPGYRTANVYNSYVHGYGGLTGRISSSNSILGGSTGDLFVDAANGDYRLARYSLAVNGGDGTYLRTLEATHAKSEVDLNGNLRVDNGVVDMGCYESQNMVDVPSTKVTTELDVDDPTDGVTSIREALAYAVQNSTLGNTVTFDASLDGKTIVLDGALELTREVNFNGGDVNVTLSGGGENAIFSLALSAGSAAHGGGGPGVGAICCAAHLVDAMPQAENNRVSSALY
ncbi:MAG: hypothetical protein IIW01_00740, partial [Thermoguttaceae bacterium]|nr:hypothetical protein [Thermoguttaceae bacterium]